MSLLPPNASEIEKGMEAASAVPALPLHPVRAMWDPYVCPEHLLPWLAWSFSVDNWDATWPLAVRRAVVANAILVQRKKGTVGAVRRAIASFGAAMSLREWWQISPPDPPGTFSILLSIADQEGGAPSAEFVDAVVEEVTRTKPLSRHFTFALSLEADAQVGLIGAVRPCIYARQNCIA